jgi:hypothetical protein
METTIWIAYNAAGDVETSTDDAQSAMDLLIENHGADEGARVVALSLTLPAITPMEVSAVIPTTDLQVNVAVRA